ncbi:hypothetical protein ACFXA3_00335 [Streptomyces sp. NPDC059456]|uniref:hypothetical protein n=1 Tax=Streptomyces sp. NPDC059456 TaxID=3346838 RepID=UPI0036A27CE1
MSNGLIAQFHTRRGSSVEVRPNPASARNIVAGCRGCLMANGSTSTNAADLMRGWAQVHAANCDS